MIRGNVIERASSTKESKRRGLSMPMLQLIVDPPFRISVQGPKYALFVLTVAKLATSITRKIGAVSFSELTRSIHVPYELLIRVSPTN
jgi:hypothetical protein